jgi:hypothetical protein
LNFGDRQLENTREDTSSHLVPSVLVAFIRQLVVPVTRGKVERIDPSTGNHAKKGDIATTEFGDRGATRASLSAASQRGDLQSFHS